MNLATFDNLYKLYFYLIYVFGDKYKYLGEVPHIPTLKTNLLLKMQRRGYQNLVKINLK